MMSDAHVGAIALGLSVLILGASIHHALASEAKNSWALFGISLTFQALFYWAVYIAYVSFGRSLP